MKELPLFVCGVWNGHLLQGNKVFPLRWTLTFSPSSKYPSAFGASLSGNVCTALHGTWDSTTKKVNLVEINKAKSEYIASLELQTSNEQQDIFVLSGVWKQNNEEGTFIVCKEPTNVDTHVSGLWIGTALPDPSLTPFMIPINPICWCLTLIRDQSAAVDTINVFGSGYFDDAADIPNQPVLFYTLAGQLDPNDNSFSLRKIYEASSHTQGYELEYNGTLAYNSDTNQHYLEGTWTNPKGGSYGSFMCGKQPASTNLTSHLCICEACSKCVSPGETRWSCLECNLPWICCDACHISRDIAHPHSLLPEIMIEMKTARGSCTAELTVDSFDCFSKRPLLYHHLSADNSICISSYCDVKASCAAFVSGMHQIYPKQRENRPVVVFCADISPSYVVTILACVIQGFIILPIHAALDDDSIKKIFDRAQPNICIFDEKYQNTILSLANTSISLWIQIPDHFNPCGEFQSPTALPTNKKFISLPYILTVGKQQNPKGIIEPHHIAKLQSNDVSAILYTSGSTGVPKGAIFTEELIFPTEGSTTILPFIRMDFQQFDPSFILSIVSSIQCGGSRILSSPEYMPQDFLSVRPTHMGATPVFWNNLFQEYLVQVNEALRRFTDKKRDEIEVDVSEAMRRQLGHRLFVATSGGAPISPQVLEFAKEQLKLDIVDLYGSRECGGITRDGIVYPGIDIHLLSLPELGYYYHSSPPQGEICVHSPRLIPGYWKDDELTATSFIEVNNKKYYRTGDVGELIVDGEKRRLRVIGRSSFVFKLAQGEWIAPEKIESLLEQCPWIEQAFVWGSSSYTFPIAVIVPSKLIFSLEPFKDLSTNSASLIAATKKIQDEIRFWCSHNHLRMIEVPQSITLEFTPWSPDNGFMTSTLKKKRQSLTQKYQPIMEELFSKPPEREGTEEKLSQGFLEILQKVFGSEIPASASTMFAEVGDSLMAVKFVRLLKEARVSVNMQSIYEYSFGHLSSLLDTDAHGAVCPMPQSNSIDWDYEWKLESYFTSEELRSFQSADKRERSNANGVLLTGCTGFLGPILLSEILLEYPSSKVFCLVRENSSLVDGMKQAQVWQPEFLSRIEIVKGDLSQPRLGISEELWKMLGKEVSDVFHSGAWVNVSLPYSTLKATNVQSTVEIIRLALMFNLRVHFISSISTLTSNPTENWLHLSSWDMKNKGGYAQSKAVSERLLHQAHLEFGMNVSVFRPGTISGDSRTGYSNIRDFTNLVIFTCLSLRIAVRDSAFVLSWIPVDFVARAIVRIAQQEESHGRVFHLCGEGPSLEQVICILLERGFEIRDVSPMEWKWEVLALPDSHLAAPLRGVLQNLDWGAIPNPTPTRQTKDFIHHLTTEILWPLVDNQIIFKYIDYFIQHYDKLNNLGIHWIK